MVRSLANRPGGHTRMSRAHADAKATEAAAPEATEAATAAARARRRTAIADARGRHGRLRQELAAGGVTARQLYDIDISSMNLRHDWNVFSRISAAGVSEPPSVIHSSEACAV